MLIKLILKVLNLQRCINFYIPLQKIQSFLKKSSHDHDIKNLEYQKKISVKSVV